MHITKTAQHLPTQRLPHPSEEHNPAELITLCLLGRLNKKEGSILLNALQGESQGHMVNHNLFSLPTATGWQSDRFSQQIG